MAQEVSEGSKGPAFLAWLRRSGAQFPQSLYLADDPTMGLGLFTHEPLEPGTHAMVVPRALVVHPSMCRSAVAGALGVQDPGSRLTGRDCLVLYILLHRALEEAGCSVENDQMLCAWLRHSPYVRILPRYIPTALSFTPAELSLLQDTSLQSGANARLQDTEAAAIRVRTWLEACFVKRPDSFILKQTLMRSDWLLLWRWADDMYGSRSFPERIAGYRGDVDEPVLVPGLDSFNHGRGAPVTWSYDGDQAMGKTVLTLRTRVPAGLQVLNNYGAKSNEELLLSYGFVEPGGPDDVLVLRLQGPDAATHYWQRTSSSPPASLLDELRNRLGFGELPGPAADREAKVQGLLSTARVLEALEQFLQFRRKRHRRADALLAGVEPSVPGDGDADDETIRPEVFTAVREYRRGQAYLLDGAVQWTQSQMDQILEELEGLGVDDPVEAAAEFSGAAP